MHPPLDHDHAFVWSRTYLLVGHVHTFQHANKWKTAYIVTTVKHPETLSFDSWRLRNVLLLLLLAHGVVIMLMRACDRLLGLFRSNGILKQEFLMAWRLIDEEAPIERHSILGQGGLWSATIRCTSQNLQWQDVQELFLSSHSPAVTIGVENATRGALKCQATLERKGKHQRNCCKR